MGEDNSKRSFLARGSRSVAQWLRRTSSDILAFASGAWDEEGGTLIARARRVLHDREAGSLLERIGREWKALVDAGKAKAERLEAPEVRTATDALLDDLNKEVPDERRLDLLRRAFLGIAVGDSKDPTGSVGLAFLETVRSLTGLQAQVLLVAYRARIPPSREYVNILTRRDQWFEAAARLSGVPFKPLLQRELQKLGDALLVHAIVDGGVPGQPSQLGPGGEILTDYGAAFCEFLQRAEPFPGKPT